MSNALTVPTKPVFMETIRDYRLSSLNGYVVNFKRGKPSLVPPHVYLEAIRAGAVVCEEQPEEKDEVKTDGGVPGAAEAAKLEASAKTEHIKKACLVLMARDDAANDFKADGYPKFNKVVAECPPECPSFTAGDVQEVFDILREDVSLADLD